MNETIKERAIRAKRLVRLLQAAVLSCDIDDTDLAESIDDRFVDVLTDLELIAEAPQADTPAPGPGPNE